MDHLGSVGYIVKKSGAKVCIGRGDISTALQKKLFKFTSFGKKTSVDVTELVMKNKFINGLTEMPISIDLELSDKDEIKIGGMSIGILHTPGHTKGSCSLTFEVFDNNVKYTGMLSGGIGVNAFQSPVIDSNIWGADIDVYIKTLKKMLALKVDVWLEGHPFF